MKRIVICCDGIDKNIQDAYRFLVHNYEKGDVCRPFWFQPGGLYG